MKTIIVATDFSAAAANAVDYAARMAVCRHKDLLLLHVYSLPLTYSDIPLPVNLEDMNNIAKGQMKTLEESLVKEHGGILNITTQVELGTFYDVLKQTCERIDPFVVIMGSQGTTAAERFLFGGHTVYAMKHLQWPLITVPPHATFHTINKIGLACDMNDVADTTPVKAITTWVKDFRAQLFVLNVGNKSEYNPDSVFEAGVLEELLKDLHPEYEFITHSDTDKALIDFVAAHKIDLLMVLPKKNTGLEVIFHKSHTKKLVLHSDVPLMALHAC